MARIWEDDKDYMKEMQELEAAGDLTGAAEAERKRNAKIDDLGLDYAKTNKYRAYQPFEYKDFDYDYKKDDSYKAYAKEYTRNMQRATEDTLGKYAGMTGGMPSTAAMGAAVQAGAYEMSKLSDKIPELEQMAHERWNRERNQAYDEHLDTRDFAWKQRTDAMDRARHNKEYDDKQAWQQKEWDYGVLQDQVNRGMEHFKMTGDAGGLPEEYYTPEARADLERVYAESEHKNKFSEAAELINGGAHINMITEMFPELTREEQDVLRSIALDIYRDTNSSPESPGAKIRDFEKVEVEEQGESVKEPDVPVTEEKTLDGIDRTNFLRLGLVGVSADKIHSLVDEGYLVASYTNNRIELEWSSPAARLTATKNGLV